jgi:hypothetical protein
VAIVSREGMMPAYGFSKHACAIDISHEIPLYHQSERARMLSKVEDRWFLLSVILLLIMVDQDNPYARIFPVLVQVNNNSSHVCMYVEKRLV